MADNKKEDLADIVMQALDNALSEQNSSGASQPASDDVNATVQDDTKQALTPVIPLRDRIIFPFMVTEFFVGRKSSLNALNEVMHTKDREIILLGQRNQYVDKPFKKDLYDVGTLVKVDKKLNLPDGTCKIIITGIERVRIVKLIRTAEVIRAEYELLPTTINYDHEGFIMHARDNLLRELATYIKLYKDLSSDLIQEVPLEDLPDYADALGNSLLLSLPAKQAVLAAVSLENRLVTLARVIHEGSEYIRLDHKINREIQENITKAQREQYAREYIKLLQKEIEEEESIIEVLTKKIKASHMPKDVENKALDEVKRLNYMSSGSPEASVVRDYVEYLVQVPWQTKSPVNKDLNKAEKILNHDHYGLDKVKERILEYLAVQAKSSKIKGPILCLVGPPGVGKTSLAYSIAAATGRKYVRFALGGVNDEAAIRGHRKTYIGAIPGRIMQNMINVGTKNPLFLLDEIDKISISSRDDPTAALLEVLDPEQNKSFMDHYLDVEYDLSNVLFIATANSFNIPSPLLDRMEVIRLDGYTEVEKFHIARNYLVAKQLKENALTDQEITINDDVLYEIIRYYTREAGVRSLERFIGKICRMVVKDIMQNKATAPVNVTLDNVHQYLKARIFDFEKKKDTNSVGEVTGLAWTEVGGDMLKLECVAVPGKGRLTFTGSLGDVMKESITNAMMVVRSRADTLKLATDFYEHFDIHVHAPEGATPKDGPSAGIAMCSVLISALTNNPIRSDTAMTGELTLTGKVIPIGGLKEKLLAANRGGISNVLIPADNVKDLEEIPQDVIGDLHIIPVKTIDDVLPHIFVNKIGE